MKNYKSIKNCYKKTRSYLRNEFGCELIVLLALITVFVVIIIFLIDKLYFCNNLLCETQKKNV